MRLSPLLCALALLFAGNTAHAGSTTTITFSESQTSTTGFNGQSNPYLTSSDGAYTAEFFWLGTSGHDHVSSGVEYNHDNSGGNCSTMQGVYIERVDGSTFDLDQIDLYGDATIGIFSSPSSGNGNGTYSLYSNTTGSTSSPGSISIGLTGLTHVFIGDPGCTGGSNGHSLDNVVLSNYDDLDGDGYTEDVDCDDSDSSIYPGADEYCDGVDNDCDGTTDEDDAVDASTWYEDQDGDGYGNPSSSDITCYQPTGYVADNTDCNDRISTTNPGASEYCDTVDNDCDGSVDEDDAVDVLTWYRDGDSDGYGAVNYTDIDCYQPTGYVADNTDCDDRESTTYPGANEYCDGHDDDCDGDVDEDDSLDVSTWYADSDGDGEGDAASTDIDCYQPSGYVENSTDCDDSSAVLNTSDADGDGTTSCESDCDDTDSAINVSATETWYDGVDQNCDGWSDYDQDGDGFDSIDYDGDDCDDEDEDINLDAEEIWYDGVDQDCDTLSDYDADYDGQDSESYGGDDCDDADPATYTGAPDTPYDGIITDCLNANDYDADGDGALALDYGGTDCDDANSAINADAEEIWYDGIDQDCDGNDDDQDGDGWALDDDCDDEDADSYPDNGLLDADCNPIETGDTGDTGLGGDTDKASGGCSTAPSSHPSGLWALALGALAFLRRRKGIQSR